MLGQNNQNQINNMQMGQMQMGQMNMNNQNGSYARIKEEYKLCTEDNDLIQIGCNFGVENFNYYL